MKIMIQDSHVLAVIGDRLYIAEAGSEEAKLLLFYHSLTVEGIKDATSVSDSVYTFSPHTDKA